MSDSAIDGAYFRHVLGHNPTGVVAITAHDPQGQPLALVVGTFTSVSLDPPLVGFLPDRSSTTWPQIFATGHFCANIMAADQGELCRQLAGKGDKFAGIEYTTSQHGLPVLPGVLASIECRIETVLDAGDHWFVLGRVLTLEPRREGEPMIFHRGRYGAFASLS